MYSYQALSDQALVMQLQLASYHGSKKQTESSSVLLWML